MAVLVVWALLPIALAIQSIVESRAISALAFGVFTVTAAVAAGMAYSRHRAHQNIAVGILFGVWLPCLAATLWRFFLSFGERLSDVAASPLGFIVGIVGESLFVATLPVFAVSIWRRRTSS